ncbi:protein transport protein Sec16A-like [Ptychodera flava]|uniref:protein transport protein Sec16A-like n=1 Tax=Ptychodera flava TaxID=63121 RepID=UPI00396A53AF
MSGENQSGYVYGDGVGQQSPFYGQQNGQTWNDGQNDGGNTQDFSQSPAQPPPMQFFNPSQFATPAQPSMFVPPGPDQKQGHLPPQQQQQQQPQQHHQPEFERQASYPKQDEVYQQPQPEYHQQWGQPWDYSQQNVYQNQHSSGEQGGNIPQNSQYLQQNSNLHEPNQQTTMYNQPGFGYDSSVQSPEQPANFNQAGVSNLNHSWPQREADNSKPHFLQEGQDAMSRSSSAGVLAAFFEDDGGFLASSGQSSLNFSHNKSDRQSPVSESLSASGSSAIFPNQTLSPNPDSQSWGHASPQPLQPESQSEPENKQQPGVETLSSVGDPHPRSPQFGSLPVGVSENQQEPFNNSEQNSNFHQVVQDDNYVNYPKGVDDSERTDGFPFNQEEVVNPNSAFNTLVTEPSISEPQNVMPGPNDMAFNTQHMQPFEAGEVGAPGIMENSQIARGEPSEPEIAGPGTGNATLQFAQGGQPLAQHRSPEDLAAELGAGKEVIDDPSSPQSAQYYNPDLILGIPNQVPQHVDSKGDHSIPSGGHSDSGSIGSSTGPVTFTASESHSRSSPAVADIIPSSGEQVLRHGRTSSVDSSRSGHSTGSGHRLQAQRDSPLSVGEARAGHQPQNLSFIGGQPPGQQQPHQRISPWCPPLPNQEVLPAPQDLQPKQETFHPAEIHPADPLQRGHPAVLEQVEQQPPNLDLEPQKQHPIQQQEEPHLQHPELQPLQQQLEQQPVLQQPERQPFHDQTQPVLQENAQQPPPTANQGGTSEHSVSGMEPPGSIPVEKAVTATAVPGEPLSNPGTPRSLGGDVPQNINHNRVVSPFQPPFGPGYPVNQSRTALTEQSIHPGMPSQSYNLHSSEQYVQRDSLGGPPGQPPPTSHGQRQLTQPSSGTQPQNTESPPIPPPEPSNENLENVTSQQTVAEAASQPPTTHTPTTVSFHEKPHHPATSASEKIRQSNLRATVAPSPPTSLWATDDVPSLPSTIVLAPPAASTLANNQGIQVPTAVQAFPQTRPLLLLPASQTPQVQPQPLAARVPILPVIPSTKELGSPLVNPVSSTSQASSGAPSTPKTSGVTQPPLPQTSQGPSNSVVNQTASKLENLNLNTMNKPSSLPLESLSSANHMQMPTSQSASSVQKGAAEAMQQPQQQQPLFTQQQQPAKQAPAVPEVKPELPSSVQGQNIPLQQPVETNKLQQQPEPQQQQQQQQQQVTQPTIQQPPAQPQQQQQQQNTQQPQAQQDQTPSREVRNQQYPPYQRERTGSPTGSVQYPDDRRYPQPHHQDYDPSYDRPPSRQRRDPYDDRYGMQYDQYGRRDPDRPYSRQGMEYDRPHSRQGYDQDRYGRGGRDYGYGYEDYNRSYGRDYYGRGGYYDYDDYYRGYRTRDYYDRRYYDDYRYTEAYRDEYRRQYYDPQTGYVSRELYEGYDRQGDHSQSYGESHDRSGDVTDGSQQQTYLQQTGESYGGDQSSQYAPLYDEYGNQIRPEQQQQQQQEQSGYDSFTGYGYGANEQSWPAEAQPEEVPAPGRMTPEKHAIPHVVARFSSSGHLIKVLPNNPADGMTATVEMHSIEVMLEDTDETQQLKAFPGPLVRNDTHKSDVIRFAADKAAACRSSTGYADKNSAALLWELMVLLCRQNGSVDGTDIAELLMKDHPMVESGYNSPEKHSPTEEEENQESLPTLETSVIPTAKPGTKLATSGVDMEREIRRFREVLLFGRKKDALESAMRGGLWGHALLLASKMDSRTYANVMTRFANSLPINDPLQTLYQMMSGRQPAAATSCADEKWGDWIPHLAMIVSNIQKGDVDRKTITTMGDTLGAKGLLHAAQFCYIMAQVGLGAYTRKSTKMVLLGSSHSQPFKQFASNDAIQHTEVYEYCQLLANKHYLLPNFQAYKFMYAAQLADYGFAVQSLYYCETISNTITLAPQMFSQTLIEQLYELGNRLKYHDPQYYSGNDISEPQWLFKLSMIQQQIKEGLIQLPSASDTPMPWVYSSSNLSGRESLDTPIIGMSVDNSYANLQDYVNTFDMSDIGNQQRANQRMSDLQQFAADQLGTGAGFTMTASSNSPAGGQTPAGMATYGYQQDPNMVPAPADQSTPQQYIPTDAAGQQQPQQYQQLQQPTTISTTAATATG